ncbi:MAG: acetyl-CoA carboxylase biotin carboxyl carrier protein subunit [Rhodocyclaceae bacterium]|nr:acetyl-CoA carboxylase biotin carboxyl carrier protein subunit [Rhodocyclaceae bacterium]
MRTFRITVDGTPYEVSVEELEPASAPASAEQFPPRAQAPSPDAPSRRDLSRPASTPSAPGKAGDIASPLAATVVAIDVQAGQQVAEGQQLLVLEAMKMNTYVFAPRAGTIDTIRVATGSTVSEGQPLLSIS